MPIDGRTVLCTELDSLMKKRTAIIKLSLFADECVLYYIGIFSIPVGLLVVTMKTLILEKQTSQA